MNTVSDLLDSKGPDVIVTSPDASVQEAAVLMKSANVGATIICRENTILGIFTERDLLNRVVSEGLNPDKTSISKVMTSPVVSVALNTPIKICLDMMLTGHYRNLAVTENGVLLGQVCLPSVLTAYALSEALDEKSQNSHKSKKS